MSRYLKAGSMDEALEVLAEGGARVLAGGTDLMIHLRRAKQEGGELPEVLLDVSGLDELRGLELEAERPYLGAALTFRSLHESPQVRKRLGALSQAAGQVGSVQVRTTGTIGGNAANASPAADGVSALVALGATAVLASPRGRRRLSLDELITGPYRTGLAGDELILGFELDPPPDGAGQVFFKVGRRSAVSVARLNLAACLDRELSDPRVVLGSCFPTPRRLAAVEELLTGATPGEALWRQAGELAAQQFQEASGDRPSAVYKVPAIRRMTARALAAAWAELGGEA